MVGPKRKNNRSLKGAQMTYYILSDGSVVSEQEMAQNRRQG